jgi:hypothetical protein
MIYDDTEVRQFLTSAANHEIAKTEVSCIPYGISPKTLGGDFIQEDADNIDTMHWTVEIDCGFRSETTIYVTKNEVQYRISNMP